MSPFAAWSPTATTRFRPLANHAAALGHIKRSPLVSATQRGKRPLDLMDVRQVTLDDGQLPRVQPDEAADFAGIYDCVAAAEIRMRVHTLVAVRAGQNALQLRRVERGGAVLAGAVKGAA